MYTLLNNGNKRRVTADKGYVREKRKLSRRFRMRENLQYDEKRTDGLTAVAGHEIAANFSSFCISPDDLRLKKALKQAIERDLAPYSLIESIKNEIRKR